MRIPQKILKILEKNNKVKNFIGDNEDVEILLKELDIDELNRQFNEYPNFFDHIKKEDKLEIFSLTLVKKDTSENNYIKLKKIKLYIDILNEKIIKILQN